MAIKKFKQDKYMMFKAPPLVFHKIKFNDLLNNWLFVDIWSW